MKDNVKIVYEANEDGAKIEINGGSIDLVKGACRIVAHLKKKVELKDGAKFDEVFESGLKVAEQELKVQEFMKKDTTDIKDLLDMLKELLDD